MGLNERMKKGRQVVAAFLMVLAVFGLVPGNVVFAATVSEAEKLAVQRETYAFFTQEMGYHSAIACGLLGNMEYESDFNVHEDGDRGQSYGLFQWYYTRKASLIAYCNKNGFDYTTTRGQMEYFRYEMNDEFANVDAELRKVPNTAEGAYEAAKIFCLKFEKPSDASTKAIIRGTAAQLVYWPIYGDSSKTTTVSVKSNQTVKTEESTVTQASYTRLLKVQSPYLTGADVKYVQSCLESLGYTIDVDGVYGNGTASVVKQFQRDYNLDVDGKCGPSTWSALTKAAENKTSVSITAQPQNVTVKIGETATFSVKASGSGLTYQWYYKKSGATAWSKWTGRTAATFSSTSNDTWNGMQVYCVVKDSNGKTASSNAAKVTLSNVTNASLKITSHPQNVTVKLGETATFSVKASGSGLTYQWYYKKSGASDWSKWPGHTTAATSAVSNDTWNGMQVYCMVKDSSGKSVSSNAAKVTVTAPLKITAQPQNVTVKSGQTATFSVKASGIGLTYQWYYKKSGASTWKKWPGHTTATTSAVSNDTWNGMQVYCAVKDSSGQSVSSNAVKVTVTAPLKITSQPQNITVKSGQTATFSVKASGIGLTYQWYYKKAGATYWSKWAGHTTATTSATSNDTWDEMKVYCIVKDSSGQVASSNAATVYVH